MVVRPSSWEGGRSGVRPRGWAEPRMLLSGVRNSWLIFERKALFAWLVASARSFAAANAWLECASCSVRSVSSWVRSATCVSNQRLRSCIRRTRQRKLTNTPPTSAPRAVLRHHQVCHHGGVTVMYTAASCSLHTPSVWLPWTRNVYCPGGRLV